jgi:hypothetical protein
MLRVVWLESSEDDINASEESVDYVVAVSSLERTVRDVI